MVALDYDPTALKVAEMGYKLAKAMRAETILFHVIAESAYYSAIEYGSIMGFPGYADSELFRSNDPAELKRSSLDFLNQSKKHLGDENIKTVVANGSVSNTIIKVAREMHADIIVMGSHSKRWLEKVLVGSVTEEVLPDSSIPLFIIPTKEEKS